MVVHLPNLGSQYKEPCEKYKIQSDVLFPHLVSEEKGRSSLISAEVSSLVHEDFFGIGSM